MSLKNLIRKTLQKFNYEVRKFPGSSFTPVSVFDLSVHFLMASKTSNMSFIQVGANDGLYDDPIRKFVLNYPWTGVLIEPQPEVFLRLVKNYEHLKSRLAFENLAVSPDKLSIQLFQSPNYSLADTDHKAAVVSTDRKKTARQLGLQPKELITCSVPCTTLDALVEKHEITNLDLLQIDAEGYDLDVLRSIDLKKTTPLIIQFESGHLSPAHCREAAELLTRKGYDLHWGGRQGDALALHKKLTCQM